MAVVPEPDHTLLVFVFGLRFTSVCRSRLTGFPRLPTSLLYLVRLRLALPWI